ncbi:calcium channel voltage-dependent beta subunit associated regulatory protein [Cricetulus griseus]
MTSPPAPTLTQVPAPAGLLVLTPLPCKSTDNAGLALEGEAAASSQRARRDGESSGGGQAAGPGGYRLHRARDRSRHTANAVTCAAPPLAHLLRAPRSPFINSPPAPRPPSSRANRECRASAACPPAAHGPHAPALSLRMQPTATMATEATTAATVALTTSWDNATSRPTAEPDPILDNYVLLVVVMSLFIGGTLVVLSGVLLLCKRCWEVHQRFNRCMPWIPLGGTLRCASRASRVGIPIPAHPSPFLLRAMDEAEKTTTTYLDNGTHPIQGGPGTALLALWTRTRVTLATSWGPPLQRRPEKEEGNRERLGKGRLEAAEAAGGASPETPPEHSLGPEHAQQQDPQQEQDVEHAQCSYRDLWSLRASLELHAATASDHSSSGNDRDSVRSGDSSGSGSGGGGVAPAFPPPPESPPALRPKDGEARRLLQMDSGYASIEGRGAGDEASEFPAPARSPPRSPRAWPRRPRRDYSIDEKTDALFHEFLRHDPHFDDAPRHRARAHPHAHARKQWQQRGRQHSDPGGARVATPPGVVRPARAPLRRGDSVDCPPEGRALPTTGDDTSIPVIEEEPGSGSGSCPGSGLCVEPAGALLDKLAASLDERLFAPRLPEPVASSPVLIVAAAAPTSPDHSPA